ncbi:ORMDL family-domain-containing protein [Mycotypha africana]|uniref:ORMDL family-domain-containing protein n=1 Tax=Mycotypha africana TaxID=64632 RepID=UPI002300C2A9|nr:ORMDL family-domain-containing protein [Mycotypha africana]KAI8970389.1 ORMDL family-domain-containing protein [Mycotypha africana]
MSNVKERKAQFNLDRDSAPNQLNYTTNWMSYKGAWITTVFVAVAIKVLYSLIPFISSETSWTLTNLTFNAGHFVMFHWLQGLPTLNNINGAYDGLTVWEQIDDGVQFTATRKFLVMVPIILFLLSTHYTHYDMVQFAINFCSLVIVLIAKLPSMHQVRIFGINKRTEDVY